MKVSCWDFVKLQFKKLCWKPKLNDRVLFWATNDHCFRVGRIVDRVMPPMIADEAGNIKVWVEVRDKHCIIGSYEKYEGVYPYPTKRRRK